MHGRELVLLVRDAMRKLSLKRREQEEKLQEMRAMRKLSLSMRTESDPCLQNKLRMKHQQSTDEEQDKRHSHEDLPTGNEDHTDTYTYTYIHTYIHQGCHAPTNTKFPAFSPCS